MLERAEGVGITDDIYGKAVSMLCRTIDSEMRAMDASNRMLRGKNREKGRDVTL